MNPQREDQPGVTGVHDVAIIGCGPVGATLANLLAERGLSVLVLEREAQIYSLPRAIHFDGECMRVFQTTGVADTLLPGLRVSPGMKFVDAAGHVLIDWSRPQQLGAQGWHPSYRFHQPVLETVLRERMAQHANVELRLRHEVFAIDQQADRVELRIEDTRSGRLYRAAASYVVGCDGARSLVRRFMGTELDDLQSHERWLVLDVLLKRERPDLGDHSIQFCDPRRPSTYVRGVGERRRWELMLMPGDDPATITQPDSVWRLLSRWITPDDATLERPALYTFHSVVARGWRNGRLLIAGDAAHQTPPFMGQGMCAGIRDVSNLAWKLAEVLQGQSSDTLLDTYETERSPHVRAFIETTVRLGKVIQATDPDLVARRDVEMRAQPQIFRTPEPTLGPGAHDNVGMAGHLAPQGMADGRRGDDVVGYQFALIVRPDLAASAAGLAAEITQGQPRIVTADDPALQAWLDECGTAAALVRPDRYIAGTASDGPALEQLLQRHRTR